MSPVNRGAYVASVPEGTVTLLVGMRINRVAAIHRWVPVMRAMTAMLAELRTDRTQGLLHHRIWMSGRDLLVLQYWRDHAALMAYAQSTSGRHRRAWAAFNRASRHSSSVGIWHEIYPAGTATETVYRDMPGHGLGAATAAQPRHAHPVRRSAAATPGD